MDNLAEIVKEEVRWYAGGGANVRLIAALDDVGKVYTVSAVGHPERKKAAGVVVLARVEGDKVIIEEDRTDKPLVDALMQAGIPREQIILAYAGEKLPEAET